MKFLFVSVWALLPIHRYVGARREFNAASTVVSLVRGFEVRSFSLGRIILPLRHNPVQLCTESSGK